MDRKGMKKQILKCQLRSLELIVEMKNLFKGTTDEWKPCLMVSDLASSPAEKALFIRIKLGTLCKKCILPSTPSH